MASVEYLGPLLTGPLGYAIVAILGLLWGSFANVCIYRWPPTESHPRGQSVVRPGSRCGACGAAVRWYDNIPVVSYLLLRGRCRDCGGEFSPRYLLVEVAMAMLFVAVYHLVMGIAHADEALDLRLLRFLILAAYVFVLVVITFIDLDHKLILDRITYPAIPIFYGLGLLLPGREWSDGLIGIAVGYGGIRLIADGYYYLTGREGMGYGDGKLLAIIGALYGWQAVVVSLFAGSILGSVISITLILLMRRSDRRGVEEGSQPSSPGAGGGDAPGEGGEGAAAEADTSLRHVEVPFGPFLVAGALAYIFLEGWLKVSFAILWGAA